MSDADQTAPAAAGLDRALAAYGLHGGSAAPIAGGLINATFLARDAAGRPAAVVQRLHPVFGPAVNLDIEAVTAHLAARGLQTPRPLRTTDGALWVELDDGVWRALTYLPGETIHAVTDPGQAEVAGELCGRFHRAVDDLAHQYAFARAGVHDTAAHLERLRRAVAAGGEGAAEAEAVALGAEILAQAAALPALAPLPLRHCHGDLKISNILYASLSPARALCLIDLDTVGRQTIAYELGDALRSWCNPAGEDLAAPVVELDLLRAALAGYAAGAGGLLSPAERGAVVTGLETVTVELAARFCADVFEDRYFGWDPARFSSRREHNLVRARGQLALARSVASRRRAAEELAKEGFARG